MRFADMACPDGDSVDLYAAGDRWTDGPVPGLVDAHTHLGATDVGKLLDERIFRADLRTNVAAGVTIIRSPGLPGDPPDWFGTDEDVPSSLHRRVTVACMTAGECPAIALVSPRQKSMNELPSISVSRALEAEARYSGSRPDTCASRSSARR